MRNPALAILALALSLNPNAARADEGGSESGGGQNSIVCFTDPAIPAAIRDKNSPRYGQILDSELNAISSVESYDLYEARMPRGLNHKVPQIVDIEPNESPRAYAEKIVNRFAYFVPAVADIIHTGSRAFTDDKILVRPSGLKRVHDENDVGYIDASRCVVATMATQYFTGNQLMLQLDGRLFDHRVHSPLSQSVLFLHESIYFSARNFGKQTDSRATRTLVSTLINAAPTDTNTIAKLLVDLGMPFAQAGDNFLSAMAKKFFADMTPEINKAVRAKIRENNSALAPRYNRWVKAYFPVNKDDQINLLGFTRLVPADRLKDGSYEPLGPLLERAQSDGDWCAIHSTNERGCAAGLEALVRDAERAQGTLRGVAVQTMMELATSKLFPQIDKLPQFDAESKTKAKELVRQSIRKGKLTTTERYNSDGAAVSLYDLDEDYQSLNAIREMNFVIP